MNDTTIAEERPQEPAGTPDLAELRALLAAATPGPWVAESWGISCNGKTVQVGLVLDEDAALIVALRNHAPALLAALEQQAGALRAVEALAVEWRKRRKPDPNLGSDYAEGWDDANDERALALRAALGRDGSADDDD